MKVINLLGSNAIGKSTKMSYLVYYLEQKYGDPEIVYIKKDGKGVILGRIYNDEIFIFGKVNNKGKWVSLDTAAITTLDGRINHIIEMKNKGIKYYFFEGFFNNHSFSFFERLQKEKGLEVFYYIFIYKNAQEFLERCNNRTGKEERTLEWAEKSPGFRRNKELENLYEKINNLEGNNFKTYLLDKETDRNILIKDFFNEQLNKSEEEVINYLLKKGNNDKNKNLW